MHLCAGLTAASWIMEPFGEIGTNFSLQLSSRTQFAKISNKKVIAENQCEKHKKLEFSMPMYLLAKWKIVWILISSADLDLYYFLNRIYPGSAC